MNNNNYPLVSIPVITYNSKRTILDTLDSIKNQDYPNIELIISDDASTDNTVELCEGWLNQNQNRFVRVKLLITSTNSGISANLNRAESECEGVYVKFLAGDDMLFPNAISDYVSFAESNLDANFIFADIHVIGNEKGTDNIKMEEVSNNRNRVFQRLKTNEAQFSYLLSRQMPPSVTYFYRREVYNRLGLKNDESIKYLEDFPKWINIFRTGEHFSFIEKQLVMYRAGGLSSPSKWHSPAMFKDRRLVDLGYIFVEKYKRNPDEAIKEVLDFEIELYSLYLHELAITNRLRKTILFRLIKAVKRLFISHE